MKKQYQKSGFVAVGKVLKQTSRQRGLEELFDEQEVLKIWPRVARDFFEQTDELTRPVDFKKGVLSIACLSKELAYQIRLLSQKVVEVINLLLGRVVVFALRVEF